MSCYEFVGPPCTKGEKFFLVYSRKKTSSYTRGWSTRLIATHKPYLRRSIGTPVDTVYLGAYERDHAARSADLYRVTKRRDEAGGSRGGSAAVVLTALAISLAVGYAVGNKVHQLRDEQRTSQEIEEFFRKEYGE